MADDTVKAPCPICRAERTAKILASHKEESNDEYLWYSTEYRILKCLGCDFLYVEKVDLCSEDEELNDNGGWELIPRVLYWPARRQREKPSWLHNPLPWAIFCLLEEIYSAVEARTFRLAAMGIRSLLERIMIERVGDQGNFIKNVDKLQEAGYLSVRQRNALDTMLEAGHAATHRGWNPSVDDINVLLDIAEHVIQVIYHHEAQASSLEGKIPRRQRPSGSSGTQKEEQPR